VLCITCVCCVRWARGLSKLLAYIKKSTRDEQIKYILKFFFFCRLLLRSMRAREREHIKILSF
jgi:hypothetical protein